MRQQGGEQVGTLSQVCGSTNSLPGGEGQLPDLNKALVSNTESLPKSTLNRGEGKEVCHAYMSFRNLRALLVFRKTVYTIKNILTLHPYL